MIHGLIVHVESVGSIAPRVQPTARGPISKTCAVGVSASVVDAFCQVGICNVCFRRHYAPSPLQIADTLCRDQSLVFPQIQ